MNPLDILQSPQITHAAVVMFPVALAILGMPFVLLGAIAKMEWNQYRWVMVGWYLIISGTGFLAVLTGEMLRPTLPGGLDPKVINLVNTHQRMGEILWILAIFTAVVVLLCAIKTEWFKATCAMLAVLLSLFTAVWALFIAYYGFVMLYEYGLGMPHRAAIVAPAPAAPVPGQQPPSVPQTPPSPPQQEPSATPQTTPDEPLPSIDENLEARLPPPTAQVQPQFGPRADGSPQESYATRVSRFFREVKRSIWP